MNDADVQAAEKLVTAYVEACAYAENADREAHDAFWADADDVMIKQRQAAIAHRMVIHALLAANAHRRAPPTAELFAPGRYAFVEIDGAIEKIDARYRWALDINGRIVWKERLQHTNERL